MAEQKIAKCPNCGESNNMWPQRGVEMYKVVCHTCGYMSGDRPTKAEAITAHNRFSQAVATADALAKALEVTLQQYLDFADDPNPETEAHVKASRAALAEHKGENHV